MTDHKSLRRKLRRDATSPERMLWSRIRNKQTGYKFRRQESIGRYIVDFFCSKHQLIVEIDGIHHTNPAVRQYDKEREKFLTGQGYKVLHYSDQEVKENVDGVFLDIKNACEKLEKPPPL